MPFVTRDLQVIEHNCGAAPTVRPPWCRARFITIADDEESMTQQADLDQTDVNAIVERFERTGFMPPGNEVTPQYGDVTSLQGDFTELLERSRQQIETATEFADSWQPPVATETQPELPPATGGDTPA